MTTALHIERLLPRHAATYRALALRAYAEHPDAFTATVDERAELPLSFWQQRCSEAAEASELVLGAWRGETLVGSAGLAFETRPKTRHKALLFGMYVAPEARGHGAGERLVRELLDRARRRAGVDAVQLTVTEGNAAAERLYARCGFQRWGVEPDAMREPGSAARFAKVHMRCALT